MFPQSGQLAAVALAQLAAWEDIARGWVLVTAPGEEYARCKRCGQAVIRLADDGSRAYTYTPEAKLALTVAHLRQAHPELGPGG
jgi:hypothetical protein